MTYIVKTSSAKMPNSVKGQYRHVAILEIEDGFDDVSMISERAKGVRRIVTHYGPHHVGRTDRCAFRVALAMSASTISAARSA